ncbi:MAG: aminotransferase [Acidobacteria bacterium]|nr:aminotransferase [Acidobacteriota bacterium]
MNANGITSRRRFVGGLAAAVGCNSLSPFGFPVESSSWSAVGSRGTAAGPDAEYDGMAKLASNENPYGPSETVLKAMNRAWKYSNRYRYPDGGIVEAIAAHHGVTPENVLIGAGSAEILKAADDAFLPDHRKVVGVEPTFETVYRYATNSKAQAIAIPLRADYTANMKEIIRVTKLNARDVGLVYICNPNNPTGNIVPKGEIRMLLESIPEEIPVLIDEAYHHFVENPDYESSLKYVLQGRKVIVTRTFSKIAGLAGMRLGYGVAPREVIDQLRPVTYGSSINALAKHGGVAALKDAAYESKIRQITRQVREKTAAELKSMGYEIIPSDANFFMVNIKKDATQAGEEFLKRGILVGRKFPPMDQWLRVSIGTPDEMNRFMTAFKAIFS